MTQTIVQNGRRLREESEEPTGGLSHLLGTTGGRHRDDEPAMSLTAAATGPQGYRGIYWGTPVSATRARNDVEMILSTWHLDTLVPDASQIITEMMANAVSHCTDKSVSMEMMRIEDGVRIAVLDSCLMKPVLRQASPTDENGRGLLLIDAYASAWNWEFLRAGRGRRTVGKRVWADLSC